MGMMKLPVKLAIIKKEKFTDPLIAMFVLSLAAFVIQLHELLKAKRDLCRKRQIVSLVCKLTNV